MKLHAFRLKPTQDLKIEIEKYVRDHNIQAGFMVTCVAGLERATLRLAGATPEKQDIQIYPGPFEVVSLVGTVSTNGCHLHISLSDAEARVIGGHLKEGSMVYPTAEIIIGEDENSLYTRVLDPQTKFKEILIRSTIWKLH